MQNTFLYGMTMNMREDDDADVRYILCRRFVIVVVCSGSCTATLVNTRYIIEFGSKCITYFVTSAYKMPVTWGKGGVEKKDKGNCFCRRIVEMNIIIFVAVKPGEYNLRKG